MSTSRKAECCTPHTAVRRQISRALFFDLLVREGRAVVVNEPLYRYHKQSGSESAARPGFWLDSVRMTADVLQHEGADDPLIASLLEDRLARSLAKYHYLVAQQRLNEGDRAASACSLVRSPVALGLAMSRGLSGLRRKVWGPFAQDSRDR